MLKAALRSEQRHLEAEGVIFDSFLGSADCIVVLGGSEQSTTYADQVRGNKGHGLHPSFPYVFLGILAAMVKQVADKIGERTLLKQPEWSRCLGRRSARRFSCAESRKPSRRTVASRPRESHHTWWKKGGRLQRLWRSSDGTGNLAVPRRLTWRGSCKNS